MKVKDWVFFAILIFCCLLIMGIFMFMQSERSQCLKNPFVYGARKMGNVYCSCTQLKEGYICPATFDFNTSTFHIKENKC